MSRGKSRWDETAQNTQQTKGIAGAWPWMCAFVGLHARGSDFIWLKINSGKQVFCWWRDTHTLGSHTNPRCNKISPFKILLFYWKTICDEVNWPFFILLLHFVAWMLTWVPTLISYWKWTSLFCFFHLEATVALRLLSFTVFFLLLVSSQGSEIPWRGGGIQIWPHFSATGTYPWSLCSCSSANWMITCFVFGGLWVTVWRCGSGLPILLCTSARWGKLATALFYSLLKSSGSVFSC